MFRCSFQGITSEEEKELCRRCEYNFDHPDAFDFDLLISTLQRLKEGKKVDVPIYNFVTHKREVRTVSKSQSLHLLKCFFLLNLEVIFFIDENVLNDGRYKGL